MCGSVIRQGVLCILLSQLLLCGLAVADVEETLTYQGNKARIAVGQIKPKADQCSYEMAAAIGEMLSTALTNTERFIVLASQEEVEELAEEIDLGESEYVEEGRGPEKGLMEGADILVTGAVTAFEPEAGGGGGVLGGFKDKAFGEAGLASKTAVIIMDIKLIDIRTRRILKAQSIEAKSKSWKSDMAGGGWVEDMALSGGLGVYSNQPMEKAIRTVLAKTVDMVSKEVPQEYYRYKGQGEYTQQYGGQSAATGAATAPSGEAAESTPSAGAATSGAAAEDMTLYTKYDFVPGDKVIFYDDMKNDEEGEFPYRWNLDKGVFEVARLGKELWIMCTDAGTIRPKVQDAPLPPKYTAELQIYDNGPEVSGHWYYIYWVDGDGNNIAEFWLGHGQSTHLKIYGESKADKNLPERLSKGIHTMRVMATTQSIKCYVDQERVANVPQVEGFSPVGFRIYADPYIEPGNPMLFRGFRFAEGGKSMKQQLDEEGKIVTHGILFDPDSYTIKGESFKTLQEIGQLFQDVPELRLSIEGHTDSDGTDEHNMTLSQNRANSVRDYLKATYNVAADRLETKGWGESKPIDTNDSPEGKANNRRVELIKL